MSNKNKNKNEEVKMDVKNLPIVKSILTYLKLNDEGRMESAFQSHIRSANITISGLKHNKVAAKLKYEQSLEVFKNDLINATEALQFVKKDVKKDTFESNASATAYVEALFPKVRKAKELCDSIQKKMDDRKKEYEDKLEAIDKDIEYVQFEIDYINEED